MSAPPITRAGNIAAARLILQALGITPEDLLAAVKPAVIVPVADAPLVANSTQPKAPPQTHYRLTPQAQRVLELADRPEGVTVADVMAELDVHEPTGHRHCQRLADELHLLTRVKLPGERAHRFFARPAAAAEYVEQHRGQPAPAPVPRIALSEAERKTVQTNAKKRAAARKSAPPLGARTKPSTENSENLTFSPPRIDDSRMRPSGEPVITDATRMTIDTAKRPNARHEAAPPLPPDPRWPSFSSAPLGVNPDTGRPWA